MGRDPLNVRRVNVSRWAKRRPRVQGGPKIWQHRPDGLRFMPALAFG